MIKFEKAFDYLEWDIKMPKRATTGSAGYDIFTPIDFTIKQGETVKVPTGLRVLLEDNLFLMIVPRSGIGFKTNLRLANTVGIIDSDFALSQDGGHIQIKFYYPVCDSAPLELRFKAGEAIAQGIIFPFYKTDDDLTEGVRTGGFGSTTPNEEWIDQWNEIILPPITEEEMKQAYEKTFECQVNSLKQAFNDFTNVIFGFGDSINKQQSYSQGICL